MSLLGGFDSTETMDSGLGRGMAGMPFHLGFEWLYTLVIVDYSVYALKAARNPL